MNEKYDSAKHCMVLHANSGAVAPCKRLDCRLCEYCEIGVNFLKRKVSEK